MIISLSINANNEASDINIKVLIDNQQIFESVATTQIQSITYEIDDHPRLHNLQIVMSGKSRRHTKVNKQGEIESDVFVELTSLEFDGISVSEIFCLGKECYTHSFNNPTAEPFLDEFYGIIGCNGTVDLQFETPIYLWLSQYFN